MAKGIYIPRFKAASLKIDKEQRTQVSIYAQMRKSNVARIHTVRLFIFKKRRGF